MLEILFSAGVWAFRLLLLAALLFALANGKSWKRKLLNVSLVILVFSTPLWPKYADEFRYKRKYEQAKALFDERCKTAGEKIYRTVEGVEGIALPKLRPRASNADRADPGWAFAGLPDESEEDWYVKSFLFWEHRQNWQGPNDPAQAASSYVNTQPSPYPGYKFVDVVEPHKPAKRYVLDRSGKSHLLISDVQGEPARYLVSFATLENSDLRAHWIAGAKVSIKDQITGELLGEGTWYAFDPGLGSTVGGRSPWGFAKVCPQSGHGASPTRFFANKVLKQNTGD